jgi:hypothetical protein
MHKLLLTLIFLSAPAVAQDADLQRLTNKFSLEARQFTGQKCDFLNNSYHVGYVDADIKSARKNLLNESVFALQSLQQSYKVIKQAKSESQVMYQVYAKGSNGAVYSSSWYDNKKQIFHQSYCHLVPVK